MNHPMHHAERQLSAEETMAILKKGHQGTLSVNGDDGYPYATPVNYVVIDDNIYIHGAQHGYRVECLKKNSKACFSAIINAKVLPEKVTAAFEGVIATGDVSFVEDMDEKRKVMETFVRELCIGYEENGMNFLEKAMKVVGVLRLVPTEITGKAYGREHF